VVPAPLAPHRCELREAARELHPAHAQHGEAECLLDPRADLALLAPAHGRARDAGVAHPPERARVQLLHPLLAPPRLARRHPFPDGAVDLEL
jgi:hypothetical protein